MSFVLLGIKAARSCHLSVLRMNQTEVTGLFYIIAVLSKEFIVFFLQDTSLLCVHGLFR